MERKCVLDVPDSHPASLDEHADDIEAVGVRPDRPCRSTQTRAERPNSLCFRQLTASTGPPNPVAASSLDLDERHHPVSLDHEIDVPVPAPEPALNHPPPPLPKPPLRDPLPQLAECLPGR